MPVNCDNISISEQELLNSLLVRTNTGAVGLRVRRISAAAGNIEPVIGCAEFLLDNQTVLRHAIGLSVSGEPALILIEES